MTVASEMFLPPGLDTTTCTGSRIGAASGKKCASLVTQLSLPNVCVMPAPRVTLLRFLSGPYAGRFLNTHDFLGPACSLANVLAKRACLHVSLQMYYTGDEKMHEEHHTSELASLE